MLSTIRQHRSMLRRPMLMAYAGTIAIVRATLLDVFAEIDDWFERPPEMRTFRPSSGGWTINQVLEHVSLTNHFLMLTLRKAVERAIDRASRGELIHEGESDLLRLETVGERGGFPWIRPEHMDPTGRATDSEVRMTLRTQLEDCLSLLARMSRGEGSLCRLHMSVNALDRIDLYQWLYFLAQHGRRHLQQMASIQARFTSAPRA
jgi:hypothetical protein